MGSVFELLDEVRKRPSLYVGGDGAQRILQLKNLEQLLHGYSLALEQHQIKEPVADLARELGEHIWKTKGWSAACGPVAAIVDVAKNDEEAWELFWTLVDEFRATVEVR